MLTPQKNGNPEIICRARPVIRVNALADESLPIAQTPPTLNAICEKFKTDAKNTKPAEYAKAWFRGMNVDCGGKAVEYRTQAKQNFLGGTAANAQKMQNNWNEVICADAANITAIQSGWKISEKITYMNGQTVSLTAICAKPQ